MAAIGAYAATMSSGYGGAIVLVALFYGEISNSPMHLRTVIKHFGLRHTLAYEVLDWTFILSYLIARLVFCAYYTTLVCCIDVVPLILKISSVFLLG